MALILDSMFPGPRTQFSPRTHSSRQHSHIHTQNRKIWSRIFPSGFCLDSSASTSFPRLPCLTAMSCDSIVKIAASRWGTREGRCFTTFPTLEHCVRRRGLPVLSLLIILWQCQPSLRLFIIALPDRVDNYELFWTVMSVSLHHQRHRTKDRSRRLSGLN